MDRLKNKIAIVTGSTSGIGSGIAKTFAAEGAHVVICGRRKERGEALVAEIAEQGGSIVNIGSMASCGGDLGATAYACAKAGVDMLTSCVALQYGKEKIRCNCIRPGLIVTPQNEAIVPQTLRDIFLSNIKVNRYGCPEDIANACVYFASNESDYVTGQVINVDGGMNSHVPTVAQFRELGSRTW